MIFGRQKNQNKIYKCAKQMYQVILYAYVYAKQKINLTWPYRCIINNISKSEAINLLKILFMKIMGI